MRAMRSSISALALSATALVGLAAHEFYTDDAVVPVKGDRPTVGFGSTFRDDGSPVQMGDKITPPKALARALTHIQKDERGIKACVTAPLHQAEYDLMVDFSYQFGTGNLCGSNIVRKANAGNYRGSCEAYKEFRMVRASSNERGGPGFVRGKDGILRYDCSTLIDGKRNTRCWGVWARQKERYDKCMAVQGDVT